MNSPAFLAQASPKTDSGLNLVHVSLCFTVSMASDPCEWEIPAEHPGPDTRDATIGAVEEVEALGLDDAMSSDTAAVTSLFLASLLLFGSFHL